MIKKIIYTLWPPCELYAANRYLENSKSYADRWKEATDELKYNPNSGAGYLKDDDAEKLAAQAYDAEIKRKEILEGKASTFILAPSIATTLTAAIPPVIKGLPIPCLTAIILIFYLLALISFLVSAYYAVKVRQVSGFALIAASSAHKLIHQELADRITQRLVFARLNEIELLKKSNLLSVAENLFLNGLTFLAVASCLYILIYLF